MHPNRGNVLGCTFRRPYGQGFSDGHCSGPAADQSRGGRGEVRPEDCCRPNGQTVHPRGQGPRGYGSAARRMPAFEARDAGGVTPCK